MSLDNLNSGQITEDGKVAINTTNEDQEHLMLSILKELRVMNIHLESITGERIRREDVESV